MAMLHPTDSAFAKSEPVPLSSISELFQDRLGLVPTAVTAPSSSQGLYHKVYFVSLPEHGQCAAREVVLRIARKTFPKIKIKNEIAVIKVVQEAGVPVPKILFYSSDDGEEGNLLGYEYICMEKISYQPLSATWFSLSPAALSRVLDQLVDFFIKMFTIELPSCHYGSLCLRADGKVMTGPVLEETMWQLPDISRYFLPTESGITLNPPSPTGYSSYPDYISAFLKTYLHVISIHPSMSFMRYLSDGVQRLIDKLDATTSSVEDEWISALRHSPLVQGRLWHRDLHFGNILADEEGNIKSVLDWEFAGVGPSFAKSSSPLLNCLYFVSAQARLGELPPGTPDLTTTWPQLFKERLAARSPTIAAQWASESNPDIALGPKGRALSDVREYLRSCVEVGVRGWGNVELAQGQWREVVERRLGELGCL